MAPGGRAEIENVAKTIFNFSSATGGHFSNVRALFASMDPLSKNCPSDFLKTMY